MGKNFILKYTLVILSSFLLFFSCRKQQPPLEVDEVIIYIEKNIGDITELVESVEFIALEDKEESLLRNPRKTIIEGDRIYIQDSRLHKLAVFHESGKFLFSIHRRGEGPEEYLELKNFAMDDSLFYFIDNYAHKLRCYDKYSGIYKGKYDLPFVVDDIEIFSNGDFLFCVSPYEGGFNLKQSPHRIFITDRALYIKERLFRYPEGYGDPINKNFYFNKDEESIYFHVPMQDHIYSFSKSGTSEYYTYLVDFEDQAIPEKYRNDYEASSPYRFLYETPYFMDEYILFDMNFGEFREVIIYDKKNGKWCMNPSINRHNFILPVCYAEGKYIYSLLWEGYDNYHTLVKNGFNRAPVEVEEHLKNEGWSLVKYTLK